MIVGGSFASAGGVAAINVARWDGVKWNALGSLSLQPGGSPFMVDTSLGRLLVQDGKATLYEMPGAAEGQWD